ncbi:MAG: 30S ribosomal protein S17 [Euryarchaeota archaeon]|nr:30S ribosomal protein S17 [Euryarchaeota archaeon]
MAARDIGIPVTPPSRECADPKCPFHGSLPVRGAVLEGTVVSSKMASTVVVQRSYLRFIQKWERYERRQSKLSAHNPACVGAEVGDRVAIAECRPLSKTKKFVVVERRAPEGAPGARAAPATPGSAPAGPRP